MTGATITGMKFYASQTSVAWGNANFQVFLTEIASTTISAFNGPGTVVYTGALSISGGVMTVNFTTPYTYNGGNLLVGIYNTVKGSYSSSSWYGQTVTGASVQGYNSSALGSVTATQRNFLPKVTFIYSCHPSFTGSSDYITNITLGSINNTTGLSTGGYGAYTNLSTDIIRGNTVNLSLTSSAGSGSHGAAVWIDFNDNGEFETSERVGTYANSIGPSTTVQIPLTIPNDAAAGLHVLRVVYQYSTAGTSIQPCASATHGEGEDYSVNIIVPCVPAFSSTSDYITKIVLGSISNSTGFSTGGYGDYTDQSTELNRGTTPTLELTSSSGSGSHGAAVWIDFNDNGIFERVGTYSNIGASTTVQISLTIPADATMGSHTMRVVYQYSTAGTSIQPCVSASFGEGEDYTVNIIGGCTSRTANITNCPGTMTSGTSMTLTGTVSVGGGAVSWSSSSSSVEINASTGYITARTPGSAIITYSRATDGTYCTASYSCTINVTCATNSQTFAFSPTTGTVAEDATINISGNLTVPTGATVTSYSSDNTDVATVSNAGVVTGVTGGTAHITATIAQWTYNGVTYCQRTTTNSFTVTVTSVCDESFNMSDGLSRTIECGTTYCFYDDGGPSGNYLSHSTTETATFTSEGSITIDFVYLNAEGGSYDYMNVYDGQVDDDHNLFGGNISSTPSGSRTATSGTMIIKWKTDGSVMYSGWKAKITATSCCPKPNDVTVTNITDTSAQVGWTGSAGNYNVRYREVGSNFSEGFESGIPITWKTVDADGDGNNWLSVSDIYSVYPYYAALDLGAWAHSGTNAAASPSAYNYDDTYASLNTDHWLITPQIALGGTAKFYVAGPDADYLDDYEVLLSTTGTATTDFTTTLKPMSTAPYYTSWEEVNIDLSAYNGQHGYIAIHHVSYDMYFLLVDDFEVSGPWTYLSTGSTSINITGLNALTEYEVQVQADCGGSNESGWSPEETFVTLLPAPTVTQTDVQLPECDNGNATLVATVSSMPDGYMFHWYSDATCTTEITTGLSGTNNNTLSYPAASATQVWCRIEKRITELSFSYNGGIQNYTVPAGTSSITMEVWGAQGGYRNDIIYGGKGGYSVGTLPSPAAGSVLYVVVGGSGNTGGSAGGYNGGGSREGDKPGGGGATHIATATGVLSSLSGNQDAVLIVAGGGGSDGGEYKAGGAGGGLNGASATDGYSTSGGFGGTQGAGGENDGAFGQGGSGVAQSSGYGGAGGGGWYGGGGTTPDSSVDDDKGGGGGSGYLKSTLTSAHSTAGQREGDGMAKITVVHPNGTTTESMSVAGVVTIQCCALDAGITFPEN